MHVGNSIIYCLYIIDFNLVESSVETVKKGLMTHLRGELKNSNPLDPKGVFKLESDTSEDNDGDRTKYYFVNNNNDDDGIYFFISATGNNKRVKMKNIFTNETTTFGPQTRFTHIDLTGSPPLELTYKTLLK